MTDEQVIAMAREVGIIVNDERKTYCGCDFIQEFRDGISLELMMRFAKQVAEAEREQCAKDCEDGGPFDESCDEHYNNHLASVIRSGGKA